MLMHKVENRKVISKVHFEETVGPMTYASKMSSGWINLFTLQLKYKQTVSE